MKIRPISLNTWIVEDDPAYKTLLTGYLELLGHKAQTFFGAECLQHLDKKPDVIILDHYLGNELTGIDLLRAIKDQVPNTCVIYLSGQDKVSVVAEAHRLGSDDYIGKDSASLLRLKLKLEKILAIKSLKLKKMKRISLFVKGGLLTGSILAALLFYNLRNL